MTKRQEDTIDGLRSVNRTLRDINRELRYDYHQLNERMSRLEARADGFEGTHVGAQRRLDVIEKLLSGDVLDAFTTLVAHFTTKATD